MFETASALCGCGDCLREQTAVTNGSTFVVAVFYFSGVARGFLGAAGAPVHLATKIGSEVVYLDKQVFNAS